MLGQWAIHAAVLPQRGCSHNRNCWYQLATYVSRNGGNQWTNSHPSASRAGQHREEGRWARGGHQQTHPVSGSSAGRRFSFTQCGPVHPTSHSHADSLQSPLRWQSLVVSQLPPPRAVSSSSSRPSHDSSASTPSNCHTHHNLTIVPQMKFETCCEHENGMCRAPKHAPYSNRRCESEI
jgi:hypothetical protein